MFLPGITVRFAKWRWNRWARSGVANVDRSKVAFLWTTELASTAGRLPLLVVRCAPSEVFWLLSVGGLFFGPAHPWYRRSLPFPTGGGCFGRCSFWSHEYSEWPSGIAWGWRRVKWKTDGFKSCARMKKNGVEDKGAEGYKWFEHRSTFLVYGKTSSLWTNKI